MNLMNVKDYEIQGVLYLHNITDLSAITLFFFVRNTSNEFAEAARGPELHPKEIRSPMACLMVERSGERSSWNIVARMFQVMLSVQ